MGKNTQYPEILELTLWTVCNKKSAEYSWRLLFTYYKGCTTTAKSYPSFQQLGFLS
jgi:hypothetical protein